MTENDTLTRRQKRAVVALMTNVHVIHAADAANISTKTMYRYLSDPVFQRELRRRQDAVLSSVTSSLVGMAGACVETLHGILTDETAKAAVRARIALGWLAQMQKSVELQDLVERVSELEQKLSEDAHDAETAN